MREAKSDAIFIGKERKFLYIAGPKHDRVCVDRGAVCKDYSMVLKLIDILPHDITFCSNRIPKVLIVYHAGRLSEEARAVIQSVTRLVRTPSTTGEIDQEEQTNLISFLSSLYPSLASFLLSKFAAPPALEAATPSNHFVNAWPSRVSHSNQSHQPFSFSPERKRL